MFKKSFTYRKRTQKAKKADKLELKLREQEEKHTALESSFLWKTYAGNEDRGFVEIFLEVFVPPLCTLHLRLCNTYIETQYLCFIIHRICLSNPAYVIYCCLNYANHKSSQKNDCLYIIFVSVVSIVMTIIC